MMDVVTLGEAMLMLVAEEPGPLETVMRFSFKIMDGNVKATEGLAKAFIGEVSRQHGQDVPIWEHKVYRERAPIVPGDGPILELRRWARQFYEHTPVAEAEAVPSN